MLVLPAEHPSGGKSARAFNFANGDQIPVVALSTRRSAPGEGYAAIREASRIGYRHVDCVLRNGDEVEIGSAQRWAIGASRVPPEELGITFLPWNTARRRAPAMAA